MNKKNLQTCDIVSYLASCMCEWTEEQQNEALSSINNKEESSPYYKLLVNLYEVDKHIKKTESHKDFIIRTYRRLNMYFPTVTESQVEKHDQSKYHFKQIIGYTKRFVHSCSQEDKIWLDALKDHYQKENHHPEHHKTENMPRNYLEESIIDMIACHWERELEGISSVNNYELANIRKEFLYRYTEDDRNEAEKLLKKIQMDNNSNSKKIWFIKL